MKIPPVDRAQIELAMIDFDRRLRDAKDWVGWEQRESQLFAIASDERRYPPKQIVSLATGIPVSKFSGGRQTNEYLRQRGFDIVEIGRSGASRNITPEFVIGRVYDRWPEINDPYGGSRQSGISTSSRRPAIFLFTGDTGEQYGYTDRFDESGVFSYTGEGQSGDMQLTRGNLAITEHAKGGRALHVFQALGSGRGQRYVGEFAYASHTFRRGTDKERNDRRVIVFNLVPVGLVSDETADDLVVDADVRGAMDLAEARRRALAAFVAKEGTGGTEARRTLYSRSADVKRYVLMRAHGECESCHEPAPFTRTDGTPYLEPHHTTRVSDGGLDHPKFVGAVCPSCHREIHHGRYGLQRNAELIEFLEQREPLI